MAWPGSRRSAQASPAGIEILDRDGRPITRLVTLVHYGAVINSLQLGLATTIRNDAAKRTFLIEDLASTIVNFIRRHAPF